MLYSKLSQLNSILSIEKISSFDTWLCNLLPSGRENVTITKLAGAIKIDGKQAAQVLLKCVNLGICTQRYVVVCPNCGLHIKNLSERNLLHEINDLSVCYSCEMPLVLTPIDIIVVFDFKGDNGCNFPLMGVSVAQM